MTSEPEILIESRSPDGWYALLEDDGRVGWFYLLDEHQDIVGDVWAFNGTGSQEDDAGRPPPAPFEVLLDPEEQFDATRVAWSIDWDASGTAYLRANGVVRAMISRTGARMAKNLRGESGWGSAIG
ncbi:MAG: hypothetical protein H6722_35655 [Sandaracinus sp.]|nr:hypothetical protein [Sandaracinus sp.]